MAIAGQCSSCYYTSPTLQFQLHRRHGHLPQQPQAARRARWPRLQVAAAAGGSIKAATDAEFFQPSDTRPIMLFDGAHSSPCSLSARVLGNLLICQLPCSVCAGVCNLCNGGVRFVREHDSNRCSRPAQFSVTAHSWVCYSSVDQQQRFSF